MLRSSLAALPTSRTPSTSGDDERTEEVSVSSEEWSTSDTQAERLDDPRRSGHQRTSSTAQRTKATGADKIQVEFATAATARLNMLFQPAPVPEDTAGRMDQVLSVCVDSNQILSTPDHAGTRVNTVCCMHIPTCVHMTVYGNQVLGFERQNTECLQPLHAQMRQTALLTKQLALSSQEAAELKQQLDEAHRNLHSAQRELARQRSRWPQHIHFSSQPVLFI